MGSQNCLYVVTSSMENYKSLKICRNIDYGLKSVQAGIDSIRLRSPHCCNSPKNEPMELPKISAWYDEEDRLLKLLHILQLSKMVEQWLATFMTLFSIIHSAFHQYGVFSRNKLFVAPSVRFGRIRWDKSVALTFCLPPYYSVGSPPVV